MVAEARTRAFLLDRFWVLERSVDIEGADCFIQRRLTNRSLLDRTPPRLGVVQAKFYSEPSTTQYVHREYVVDSENKPRDEFFLVCHTGNEDRARAFLLSASDICTHFSLTGDEHSRPGRYSLPGKGVLVQRFEVLDRGSALNKIELGLRNTDFLRNRSFLSWALPRASERVAPINPVYEEPIDNWWGDIPCAFEKLRSRARNGRWGLEEILEKLRAIEESTDPEQALAIAEEMDEPWSDDLFDEDFWNVVQYHKRRHRELDAAGLLGAYAALRRLATHKIIEDLAPIMPLPRDQVYVLESRYIPETLLHVHLESRIERTTKLWPTLPPEPRPKYDDIPDTVGVLSARPGRIEVFLVPGRYGYQEFKEGQWVDTPGPWAERIKGVVEQTVGKLLEEVLASQFGE